MVSNCRYGIDCVNGADPPALSSCSVPKSSKGSQFSDSWAGCLMYASSPVSYDDLRGGGVRVALSEVLFIENCEPCDLLVFGDEEESGLLLGFCVEGGMASPLSELLGEYEGGGLATGGCGGAKDGTGDVLSRFIGDGVGLE